VAQKLVATSADLEMIAGSSDTDIHALKGWRYEIFGRDALALKEGQAYLAVENNKLTLIKKL
jgi:ribonuclease D